MAVANFYLDSISDEEKFEILENIYNFEKDLLSIESSKYKFTIEQYNRIFRVVHSLKGLLSMFNRNEIRAIHKMESVLIKYKEKQCFPEAVFELLLTGGRILEDSIRNDLNIDFTHNLEKIEASNAEITHIIFARNDQWNFLKLLPNLGIDNFIVFSNVEEFYNRSDVLKTVNKIIISDMVDLVEPSSLIKVVNMALKDADVLLIRERDKCGLSNIHDINFISFGAKDRNLELKLQKFLRM